MGYHGFDWVTMALTGLKRVRVVLQWVWMGNSGFNWVRMGKYKLEQLWLVSSGLKWDKMGYNGLQWVTIALTGMAPLAIYLRYWIWVVWSSLQCTNHRLLIDPAVFTDRISTTYWLTECFRPRFADFLAPFLLPRYLRGNYCHRASFFLVGRCSWNSTWH